MPRRPVPNNGRAATEAQRQKFAPELRGIAASLAPAATEKWLERIQHAFALLPHPKRCPAKLKPAVYRLAVGTELNGDPGDGRSNVAQPPGFLVACIAARPRCLSRFLSVGRFRHKGERRQVGSGPGCAQVLSDVLSGATGGGAMAVTKSLDSFSEIAEQMPSVGDLNSAWSALTNTVGIGAGTIASDNLDAWAVAQPGGDTGSLAIGQKVYNLVRLKVHQHGAVLAATLPRPVIDAEHLWGRCRLARAPGRCHAQQRVRACRGRNTHGKACTGFATKGETEMVLKVA